MMTTDVVLDEALRLLGLEVVRRSMLEQRLADTTAERDQAGARITELLTERTTPQ